MVRTTRLKLGVGNRVGVSANVVMSEILSVSLAKMKVSSIFLQSFPLNRIFYVRLTKDYNTDNFFVVKLLILAVAL